MMAYGSRDNEKRVQRLLELLDDTLRCFCAQYGGVEIEVTLNVRQAVPGTASPTGVLTDSATGYGIWTGRQPREPGQAWADGLAVNDVQTLRTSGASLRAARRRSRRHH